MTTFQIKSIEMTDEVSDYGTVYHAILGISQDGGEETPLDLTVCNHTVQNMIEQMAITVMANISQEGTYLIGLGETLIKTAYAEFPINQDITIITV